jgi:hypothetical protein
VNRPYSFATAVDAGSVVLAGFHVKHKPARWRTSNDRREGIRVAFFRDEGSWNHIVSLTAKQMRIDAEPLGLTVMLMGKVIAHVSRETLAWRYPW